MYIRESTILDAIETVYAERVFGQQRRELLAAERASADDQTARRHTSDAKRLNRAISEIGKRQANVLRQAQTADPNDPFTRALRTTYNDLETERQAVQQKLADVDARQPDHPGTDQIALLDALPQLRLNLPQAPASLQRRLYDVTQLNVHVHHSTKEVTINITLPADGLDDVTQAAHVLRADDSEQGSVDIVCAPGGTRTHTERILSPSPLPIGLRGHTRQNCTPPATSRRAFMIGMQPMIMGGGSAERASEVGLAGVDGVRASHPVEKEEAVAVVDLVLQRPGLERVRLDHHVCAGAG